MLKAVPTAWFTPVNPSSQQIQTTQATQHQRYDVAASFEFQMETPQIQCEVTSDLTQVSFRCGYCNCYHYHGNVPKHSPLKGHRVAHCHSDPNPYPNGYYLRTDLDKITRERFPNFAVVGNRDIEASNGHFQKCENLGMPFCIVKRRRNYACFDIDFITTDSLGMDAVIGKAIREFRLLYRASHPARRLNRKHLYDSIMVENEERSLTALLWLYVNDIYIVANVLMPILNDQSHWVKRGSVVYEVTTPLPPFGRGTTERSEQERLTALQEGLSPQITNRRFR